MNAGATLEPAKINAESNSNTSTMGTIHHALFFQAKPKNSANSLPRWRKNLTVHVRKAKMAAGVEQNSAMPAQPDERLALAEGLEFATMPASGHHVQGKKSYRRHAGL